MARPFALLFLALVACEKKPPVLGTFEGTVDAKVRAAGASEETKKSFSGVKVTIKPMVKETPLKKKVESESELTIVLEGAPFTKPCTLDGLITGGNNNAAIASSVPPQKCAMSVDTWSSDAAEISPMFEIFGTNELHGHEARTGDQKVFLSLEFRLARK